MPIPSKASNRFWHWAEENPEEAKREHGIKPAIAHEFVQSAHGQNLKNLPERVEKKAHGGAVKSGRPVPFRW